MQFLYYRPKQAAKTHAITHLETKPVSERETMKGPDGGRGTILLAVADQVSASRVAFDEERQTWRRVPGSELWVGMWNDARPTPADLERRETLPGPAIRLGDGNEWTIPICRAFDDGAFSVQLPQKMDLNDDGEWVIGEVVHRYRPLWEASSDWFDYIVSKLAEEGAEAEGPIQLMVSDVADACVTVLATNYRVTRIEVAMLELLNSQTRGDVMNATIDLRALIDHVKKKQTLGPSNTEPGQAAETRRTVPA